MSFLFLLAMLKATTLTPDCNLLSVPRNTDAALTIPVDHDEHQPENPCPIKSAKKVRSIRSPNTVPDFSHCEFYSRVKGRVVHLYGEWIPQAGFVNGMPVKIRVMKDYIVITPQNTHELWGCIEGMNVAYTYFFKSFHSNVKSINSSGTSLTI